MTEEELNAMNQLLYYIDEYNKGNKEYEEDMKYITKSIKDYSSYGNKVYLKFFLLVFYLETKVNLLNHYLMEDDQFNNLITYCYDDLSKYKEYIKVLKSYAKETIKSKDYEDLSTAYLLTIYLSNILANLNDYFKELKLIASLSNSSISYSLPTRARDKAEKNLNDIDIMVKKIRKN